MAAWGPSEAGAGDDVCVYRVQNDSADVADNMAKRRRLNSGNHGCEKEIVRFICEFMVVPLFDVIWKAGMRRNIGNSSVSIVLEMLAWRDPSTDIRYCGGALEWL